MDCELPQTSRLAVALAGVMLLSACTGSSDEPPAADTKAPAVAPPTREQLAKDNALFLQAATKSLKWEEPAEPTKIVGPIHFVGTQGLGSYLINTPDGLILLGTGTPASGPLIAASIRKLGFRPEDLKVLLTWHAHADHAGALAYFKELAPGAQVAIMEPDVAAIEDGGKSDFHYGWDWRTMGWPAVKVDRVLHDGDTVALGGVTLTALATPGHTRGDTSWTTTVTDNGKTYKVVWPDGLSVNPGYRVARNPSYPGIGDDYRRTGERLAALRPDIWLVSHTERFGLDAKRARAATLGAEAFVDREGYQAYIQAQRDAFEAEVARETAAPSAEDGVRRGPAPASDRTG
ncbi:MULTISPECIES: subclass B3 metallo-beta-lactamase [unclassified Brevundimonas]|uniref:subclass B3 metallo-beta-lactamase n=1 Tax=unclassified Brevundimonas TaxID=2622653 RepID=UPI0025C02BD2|nr:MULTISPECIES: subclass B3 metallo-beta-lactamase [unclassified Brevundimonas]